MFQLKNIKIQMYGGIIGGSAVLYIAMFVFKLANKQTKSGYYYWSKDVRNVTSAINNIGIFFSLRGVVLLGLGIVAVILKNTGKICPNCDRIYGQNTVKCSTCKTDLTYAKSVKAYLSEKPEIMSKGTSGMSNGQSTVCSLNVSQRFCAYCGKELSAKVLFCPHCGNKVN